MGMTKEIEQIFKHVIKQDLARISRSAAPSYHRSTYPPSSMFRLDNTTTGHSILLAGQDYQIVKIELDPLEAHANTRMPAIKFRRAFRNDNNLEASTKFETAVNAGEFDVAYHEYVEESGGLERPNPIAPRLFDQSTVDTDLPLIIAVAGVDYVRQDFIDNPNQGGTYNNDQDAYDAFKVKLQKNPNANVDQWPEDVILRHPADPDGLQAVSYVRFDVEYWEGDRKQNRRFGQ